MMDPIEEAEDRAALAGEVVLALEGLLAVIHDSDQRKRPSAVRMLSIVSGRPEFAAVDAARATLAKARQK